MYIGEGFPNIYHTVIKQLTPQIRTSFRPFLLGEGKMDGGIYTSKVNFPK